MSTREWYHLTPARVESSNKTHAGKDVEKLQRLCVADEDIKQCSHCGIRQFLKKLKIELLYDAAIPFSDVHSEIDSRVSNVFMYPC